MVMSKENILIAVAGIAVLALGTYMFLEDKKEHKVPVVDVKDRPKTIVVSK